MGLFLMDGVPAFVDEFTKLEGVPPFFWQQRFFGRLLKGDLPAALDLPTGLGKTSVMAIWYLALRAGAPLPRRLVYVVDRRAVVDQATTVADKIKKNANDETLRVSTLRGRHVDNRDWLNDPAAPAIIVGTVDMIGSRLLFSGYGVSPKMRPYHAGLLGADTLVVLDEAHLVPPFEKLLEAIEGGTAAFGPRAEADRGIIPSFNLLSLSATGRAREGDMFQLEEADLGDEIVKKRLDAKKSIDLAGADDSQLADALAKQAWLLADEGGSKIRCLVYCNSRETAERTAKAIEELAKGDQKKGHGKVDIDTELFVGARRVREREDAARKLDSLGFLAGQNSERAKPAFLIATSAGEVGVDLDADHMVCDLVPWERMVQRLGRVNRRGEGNARIIVVDEGEPKPKKADEPTPEEGRRILAYRALAIVKELPRNDCGFDASPGALRKLKQRAMTDEALRVSIDAATTPAPLRPALTSALVDAWSMTSLKEHTGRPEIGPWLRGWIEDDQPQTTVVWRKYLPVRIKGGEALKKEVEDFFEAAPPHASEELETETYRIVEWLMQRAERLIEKLTKDGTESDGDAETSDPPPLKGESIVAFALAPDGTLRKSYRLRDLVKSDGDKKRKERLEAEFPGGTLVVDVRLGGLTDGLLKNDDDMLPPAADSDEEWSREIGMRIRRESTLEASADSAGWRFEDDFVAAKTEDGEVAVWLIVERLKTSNNGEDGRAISNPQSLSGHQASAADKARALAGAAALGLRADLAHALEIAARLHDEGKRVPRWQRAFNADRAPRGIERPLAKTRGPFNRQMLDGYRHEFGSLPRVECDPEFIGLPSDLQDLVLHIVAAHHGGARPVISTKACDDAPPSALEARARDVALRFARLQKTWGPWGLAWWESLLRAADQQASRANDERADVSEKVASEEAA
jgi:CRISPR-associated endonuclease/helicase Cas3